MEAMKDYVAHLDNKKRITLRGAAYQYYNVKEYGNGCIILEPRELAVPESISARTLADMDHDDLICRKSKIQKSTCACDHKNNIANRHVVFSDISFFSPDR